MGTNLADTRIIVIAAAQLSTEQARMREERPPAGRPIEAGEPHAALPAAGDGQADHRRVLTTAPRASSGYPWHSARHSRLGAAPRPHRVRRLRRSFGMRQAASFRTNPGRFR